MIVWSPPAPPAPRTAETMAIFNYPWGNQTEWGTPPACRPGSSAKDGKCDPDWICPSNFKRNATTGWCDPLDAYAATYCGPDAHYESDKGFCVENVCKLPFVFDMARNRCVFQRAGQFCCPGQDPSAPCILSEYVFDEEGGCTPAALPHCRLLYGPQATYDPATGKCGCPAGMEKSDAARSCVPVTSPEPPPDAPDEPSSSDTVGAKAALLVAAAIGATILYVVHAKQAPEPLLANATPP